MTPVEQAAVVYQRAKTLRVRQWERTRYWVQSQTRKGVEHLVDSEDWTCSCEWSCDFRKADEQKTWCAHIQRVRQWIQETAEHPKNSKEALKLLKLGRSISIPSHKSNLFIEWISRRDRAMAIRIRIKVIQERAIITP